MKVEKIPIHGNFVITGVKDYKKIRNEIMQLKKENDLVGTHICHKCGAIYVGDFHYIGKPIYCVKCGYYLVG